MASNIDDDFETGSADASNTVPKQMSAFRKNDTIIIKDRPCKIVEMSTSKTGKHGHAKVHVVAIDVFTDKKYEDIAPSTCNRESVTPRRMEFQLLNISHDGFVSMMSLDGSNIKEDLKLPETDVGNKMRTMFEEGKTPLVTVLSCCNEEKIVDVKGDNS